MSEDGTSELNHPDRENFPLLVNESLPITSGHAVHEALPRARHVRLVETILSNPDQGTAFDDRFYQQLTAGGVMDLPPEIQQKLQRLALLSYRKNPFAFASTEVRNDFVVGGGVKVVASDRNVQGVIDQHWQENSWDARLPERSRALSIFGEQLYPTFIRPEDGMVYLTSITPLKIIEVLRSHDDSEVIQAVQVSGAESVSGDPAMLGAVVQAEPEAWSVIERMPLGGDLGPCVPGREARQAFFFTINRVAGGVRGSPDMASSMDWMEGLDGIIFSLLERAELTQDVVFDLLYEGANSDELRGYAKEFAKALRSGGIFAHNERTKLSIETPNLVASDAGDMVKILKGQVYAGTRLHGLFMGSGEDLTRSSAAELSIPTAKHFEARQSELNRMLRRILDFQIQESRRRGMLPNVTDFRYQVIFPRIFLRDMSTIASSLQLTSIALQLAQQNQWISSDEASNAFRKIMEAFGADVSDMRLVADRPEDNEASSGGAEVAGLNDEPSGGDGDTQDFQPGDDLGDTPTGPPPRRGPPGPKLESVMEQTFVVDGQRMVVDLHAPGGFSPAPRKEP